MTKDDIVGFASLVKISITDNEAEVLLGKMDSILGYIDQIQKVEATNSSLELSKENPDLREDILNEINFTNDFMQNVPDKEADYVKVPKVLNTD
jgi:aspartyl-tRNA(Asn)/glutamyl-tRNA(Gln) amidotransferase subunit C